LPSINHSIPSGFPHPADGISEKVAQRKENGWSWKTSAAAVHETVKNGNRRRKDF
jgi:hypothetical protein